MPDTVITILDQISRIISVLSQLVIIFAICWIYDTYNHVKKLKESQDYENQRIYEIENQLEEIMIQQERIEKHLKEQNHTDNNSDETQNE